jgi:hypothetical protein
MWGNIGGNTDVPAREAKLRRGESHERGKCETSLTRNHWEETVKMVTKP